MKGKTVAKEKKEPPAMEELRRKELPERYGSEVALSEEVSIVEEGVASKSQQNSQKSDN